ncbi:uncharacterized protein KIAA2026 isoform X2 [Esox lucius]|uniref:Bromo domain-containing protein n=1 Tax=Esox lucius TaxID=8010 RepID=A0A3P8XQG2_ESOLU|nr:uncharacterized protein KIAA2026 isoform X2 [Esox lucius]
MKVQTESCNPSKVPQNDTEEEQDMSDKKDSHTSNLFFLNQDCQKELGAGSLQNISIVSSDSKSHNTDCNSLGTEELLNGTSLENVQILTHGSSTHALALTHGVPEISNELSLPEVCIPTTVTVEEDLTYEIQQAYRIFHSFLLEKHKGITTPFLHPIGLKDHTDWAGGHHKQSMCFRRMEEKFVSRAYETITDFVADFRLMLENCYRHHGVDHWISKQAQKLEIMLEQKLTLLSRTLREKTSLALTSKGRFGTEDERGPVGTSTRRRSVPRSLATITVGGNESIMVQALRLEEQQRVKEEKRQRELEKKEAEETSAKEVEEWERSLLSQASETPVKTLWELPAIGHFLCLAQAALNLPEIVFFELERCLLMPRCSIFLSKVMSSLLCQPQRRGTLHRRPALSYRCWEFELRKRVQGWYYAMGTAEDQGWMAEQLGLSHQFFRTVGEVSPLENNPFHLLPFIQRVWLLKGLCDNVYETQKEVQDAVLGQPIHECRESILGYDGNENAYIHFPHFCGADLRIYCQSASLPPEYPLPVVWVKRVEPDEGVSEDSDEQKHSGNLVSMGDEEYEEKPTCDSKFKGENGGTNRDGQCNTQGIKEEDDDSSVSEEDDHDRKKDSKHTDNGKVAPSSPRSKFKDFVGRVSVKKETHDVEFNPDRLRAKQEEGCDSSSSGSSSKSQEPHLSVGEPHLSVGEHCYKGKSPARSATTDRPSVTEPVPQTDKLCKSRGTCSTCVSVTGTKSENNWRCCCAKDKALTVTVSGAGHPSKVNSTEEKMERIRAKKKKKKKNREFGELHSTGGQCRPDRSRLCKAKAAKSTLRRAATIKKKDKRRKCKTGKKLESVKLASKDPQLPVEPAFRLVCSSLEELRELINKTEDELDELESTKKRSVSKGKWYVRREAVKDLHITLIRLLNELSPWEPKLVKAFHRNRLRLKKDYDDFRKHPDYDNFVREEWVAEDMDRHPGDQLTEEEDYQELDKTDQRILWTGEDTGQLGVDALRGSFAMVTRQEMLTLNEHRPSTRGLKRLQSGIAEELSVIKRGRIGSEIAASPGRLEMENHPRDGNPAAHQLEETGAAVVTSVTGLQRPYKPIQLHTLLAKSVGNKVTLIHHQPGTSVISHVSQAQSKACASSMQASKPQSSVLQSSEQLPQPPTTTATRTQTQTVNTAPIPKSPVKVVYKMPEGLGQVRKDGSPVKIAVQPVLDQKTGDEIMQRVVILPSNLLIQKSEDKIVSQHARTSSKASTPLSKSSRVTVPQNQDSCISIQQVAPLKGMSPSPTVSPRLQTSSTPGFNVVRLPDPKASSTIQNVIPNRSPSNPTSAVSNDPSKPLDPNQELKTVCIRDSQSILVTTRGGNTGVVKVQTSNQGTPGSLPASPVITISPQFKAFLVSKTSPPAAPTVPVLTSSTLAQAQSISQLWSSTGTSSTTPRKSPITAGIPVTAGSNVAISQGFPVSSKLAVNSQLPESSITVPGKPAGATQTSLVHCVPKPVLKRVNPDEMCTFTKFILVSSSSNITNKVTSTTATSALPGQRVVFISQSPSTGCIPKTTTSVSGATTQSVTTSMPNEALKIGVNIGQAISSTNFGALNKVQSINLLSGSQMRLPLQANLSKPVSAPVRSTLKSTSPSASKAGLLATTTSQVVSSTAHLPSSTLLVGSQVQGKPISSIIKGLIPCNSQQAVPVTTPLSPVKTSPLTPLAQVSQSQNSVGFTAHAQSLSTSQSPAAPRSCQQSSPVRSAVNTNAVSSTTVQQKIVINTSAPLAGGTQILLNNTRFVVPPQGLRPGQHILIISSPAVPVITPCPGGVNPTTGVPRRSALPGLAPPAQGPRMAAPPVTHKAQQAALKSPTLESLSTAEIRPSVPVSFNVPRQMMAVRGQLLATSTATNSSLQVSHQLTGPTVGLANVVAAPPLTLPERMATFAPSSVQGSLSTAQTAVVSQTATKQLPLHTGIGVNGTLKTQQLATLVQPTRAVSTQMQVLPTVAVPPIGSTVSKMQPLAVVTVPPIGSAISSKQASPLATVPQSNCTVIMTPAQPIRTIMSAETIRMPIVLSNPLQQHTVGPGKPTLQNLQIPALAAQTTSPTTKLLVSPDGAVLNMVRGPMTHTGLTDVTKKPLAALIVTPSSTGIVLPPPTIKTGNPSMPNPTDSSGPIS